MKLSLHIDIKSIPFKHPVAVRGITISDRQYIQLTATDQFGHTVTSEVSPLDGLHQESIDEASEQLNQIKQNIAETGLENIANKKLYPSVKCGLDILFYLLKAKQKNSSLANYLNPQALSSLPINALLNEDLSKRELNKTLDRWMAEKRTCIKIKLGRQSLNKDIRLTKHILSTIDPSVALRLDINQQWTLSEFQSFIHSVDLNKIEYIEEPVIDYRQLDEIPDIHAIKIALDESILNVETSHFQTLPAYIKALVIKPMILGGITPTIQLASLAHISGRYLVISSSYESPTGLDNLYQLALATHKEDIAAGLDTGVNFVE